MRVENSIKNTLSNIICNICIIIIGLIAQSIFIKILGAEYLGINGLFTNILSILGIIELGIGSAITFNLYKPVAENDIDTVKSLMKFYKKAYNIIFILVIIIGVLIVPFLDFFVGKVDVDVNIRIIYILFLLQTASTYVFCYKSAIFIAHEKNFIVKINHMLLNLTVNIIQLICLYLTKNYYLYLIVKIIIQILFNLILSIHADIKYPYIKEKNIKDIDKNIENDIFKKIKALFFHKIGQFLVNGTDNIIISKFINVYTVGIYSNYYLIINAVSSLFGQMISSITASVGNLLVENNKEKNYNTYKKILFFNFWITTFSCISILLIIQPFIEIWVGKEFVLPIYIVITLVINLYQKMMRYSLSTFKDAAGIWYEDRFIPLVESIINIIASIILVKLFGLTGVFIGTILSGIIIWCYSYPKFVYKRLFNHSYIEYAKENLSYFCLFVVLSIISYAMAKVFIINNNYIKILINTFIALILPNTMMVIIFKKNESFIFFINLFKKMILKLMKKSK